MQKRPTPSKRNSPRGSRTSNPSWGMTAGSVEPKWTKLSRVKSNTSAASDFSQLPRSYKAAHSRIPYRRKKRARAEKRLSLCKVGWHRRVQHRLAERRSTTLLPFQLSPEPTKAEILLSKVSAREKPLSPELIHGAAKRFESDATRLSSQRRTIFMR